MGADIRDSSRTGSGRVQVARVHSGLRRGVVMAIVVLVLWLFTAGAGFYLLVTSNLGRARPAAPTQAAEPAPAPAAASVTPSAHAAQAASAPPPSKREMRRAGRGAVGH